MTDELTDLLDEEPDPELLANHVLVTIDVLADEIDADDAPDAGGVAGMMGPETALNVMKPLLEQWAQENPEQVLKTLARIKMESGALLAEHAVGATPTDLLDDER